MDEVLDEGALLTAWLVKDTNASDPGTWEDLFLVPVGMMNECAEIRKPNAAPP